MAEKDLYNAEPLEAIVEGYIEAPIDLPSFTDTAQNILSIADKAFEKIEGEVSQVTIFHEFFSKAEIKAQDKQTNEGPRQPMPYIANPAVVGGICHQQIAETAKVYNSIVKEISQQSDGDREVRSLTNEQLAAIHAKAEDQRRTPRTINPGFTTGLERDGVPRDLVDIFCDGLHKVNGDIAMDLVNQDVPKGFIIEEFISEGLIRASAEFTNLIKKFATDNGVTTNIMAAAKEANKSYYDILIAAANGDMSTVRNLNGLDETSREFLEKLAIYSHYDYSWLSSPPKGLKSVIAGMSARFDLKAIHLKPSATTGQKAIVKETTDAFSSNILRGANPLDPAYTESGKGKALLNLFSAVGKGDAHITIIEKKTSTALTGKPMDMGDRIPDKFNADIAHTLGSYLNLITVTFGGRHPRYIGLVKKIASASSAIEGARITKNAPSGAKDLLELFDNIINNGISCKLVRLSWPTVDPINGGISLAKNSVPEYRIDTLQYNDIRKWLQRVQIDMLNKFIVRQKEIQKHNNSEE